MDIEKTLKELAYKALVDEIDKQAESLKAEIKKALGL